MNADVTRYPAEGIAQAVQNIPTPFHLYEEQQIRKNCRLLKDAFEPLFPDFTPLYAVKANSNPHLLKIIMDEGFGFDCSSYGEIMLTRRLQHHGMYTGCYTTEEEYRYLLEGDELLLNLDDITGLDVIKDIRVPEFLSFRINPNLETAIVDLNYAGPNGKYGVPIEQAIAAYRQAQTMGVERFGMHTMPGCGALDVEHPAAVLQILLDLARQLHQELGIELEYINPGTPGGVPYHPDKPSVDLPAMAQRFRELFDEYYGDANIAEPKLMLEPGRMITSNAGFLVTKVHVIKDSYRRFIGVDACAANLMRPAFYGAYHHISVLGKDKASNTETVNVVGRIMENNDQFAQDRELPHIDIGDVLVIHDTGAHGYVMGYNYNTRPRAAEYLLEQSGDIRHIRHAETVDDLLVTILPWDS